jgi:apolipoprotein D and lipocalin family protein
MTGHRASHPVTRKPGDDRRRSLDAGARQTLRLRGVALVLLCVAVTAAAVAGVPPQAEVRTVATVDLDRYVGDWFEIARFPNRFQRRCEGEVTASYARRSDGRLDVVNRCRTADGPIEARGVARILDDTGARLKVRFAPAVLSFLPFVWGDYWILSLADDYSWALVGSPDRDYLWVLSRTPTLDAGSFARAEEAARVSGFSVDRLERTPQRSSVAN